MPGFFASSRQASSRLKPPESATDAQDLRMVDQRVEQTGFRRDRQLQHHALAFRNSVKLFGYRGKQQPVAFGTVGALDIHLGLDDRHHAVR
jgi:hypothetical protein